MSAIKIFRSCVMTGVLVMLLLIGGRFFLTGYKRYVVNQNKKAVLTRRANLLNQQQSERKQKMHHIFRVNRFVNNAKLLGLEKRRWAVYHVDIQDAVTFTEMKRNLMQCTNSASRYFRPVSFHIKSLKATHNNAGIGNKNETSEMLFKNKTGDILMTLKGAFVVREEAITNDN
ncbi:MAG: hypothetical protein JRF31_02090 [Deltaproteobacteria bacterium]|nr:hypothetical protein [Deltaproteobacteria bacterium]MBW1957354.1 hypothetical protein [Deltaproteobacteria bacterium]MBW2087503.1 hypothetical protein [Deltaproteobacteria bacterium]MBW2319648.1 hypothetical protein [Deltaproteobacteria bacterium]